MQPASKKGSFLGDRHTKLIVKRTTSGFCRPGRPSSADRPHPQLINHDGIRRDLVGNTLISVGEMRTDLDLTIASWFHPYQAVFNSGDDLSFPNTNCRDDSVLCNIATAEPSL